MIQPKNIKFKKNKLSVIICASVLLLLIAGYVVIEALIGAGAFKGEGDNNSATRQPLDLRDGEATYNGQGVAYPYVSKNNILSVTVDSDKDAFVMARPNATDENGDIIEEKYLDYFVFSYDSGDGKRVYYPDILVEEPNTSYTDLYAIEGSDGLNAYKIDYLCAAIGALYFSNRIDISEEASERAKQLERYGLSGNEMETIYISYVDSEGQEKEHVIFVGDKLVNDAGYYFMIKGRSCVYTTFSTRGFGYLLGGFEQFLHSRLVAEGLPTDGVYEPYLTTDYKQWTNKYYGDGEFVTKDAEVIIEADLLTPKYIDNDLNDGDGYNRTGYKKTVLDLKYISGKPEFSRIISIIEGSEVRSYENDEIVATVITNINEAKLNVAYRYTITGIESVLTDTAEYDETGYAVGTNNLVKVMYRLSIQDGTDEDNLNAFNPVSNESCHAVIDLSADNNMPEDVKNAIRAAKVGDSLSLTYDVTYTEENAVKREMSYVITDIHYIQAVDSDGNIKRLDTITENSIVTFSYKWFVDGRDIGMEETRTTVDLSRVTDGDNLTMKNAIIGSGINPEEPIIAFRDIKYCQNYADFNTYKICNIVGFVEKEMIVSFEFANPADGRDPFYGESIYKNTLEKNAYALNSISCQNVTYLLGGLGSSSNSQQSAGLVGLETVDVGLTPDVMYNRGLYDGYTIYFELPRGIYIAGSVDGSNLDNFNHFSTLGFTLYISKTQSDGTRYIASTMYDIVAKIDGSKFDYLEKSFEEYWARQNLVMIDYKLIDNVDIEIATNDVFGKYSFTVDHKTIYIVDNEHLDVKPEQGGTEYDELNITVRPDGEISETAFANILKDEGRESLTLANLYDRVAGEKVAIGHDTAGAANYKEFLSLLYAIYYVGYLDEAEQKEVFESSPKIFSITFTVSGDQFGRYTYDFYRVSDRKVMVHIYERDFSGSHIVSKKEISGFYISTFAAKKMISAVTSMLNGENIDVNNTYWD